MSYQAPLPNTGVILPVLGSGQAWEGSVYNGNFTGVDAAIGADRTRLSTIEGKIGSNALVPAGTTAARDGFYGIPSTAAARIALANAAPRWFNTDKGYLERYFAATGDSATGGYDTKFAKTTAGWKAEGAGLVPVDWGTVANTGGTVVKNGNVLVASGAVTAINTDGTFTDEFIAYKILYDMQLSVAGYLAMRTRTATVVNGTAASYSRQSVSAAGAAVAASTGTDDKFLLSAINAVSFLGEATIWNPALATRVTLVDTQAARADQQGRITQQRVAGVDDGAQFTPSAGGTFAGTLQLFGYAGGHI